MIRNALWAAVAAFLFTVCATDTAVAQTVNGLNMVYKSNGGGHDTTAWKFLANGYLGTLIRVDAPGPVTVTVRAGGASVEGKLPVMRLRIGDRKAEWQVTDHGLPYKVYDDHTAVFDLPTGTHAVRVEYTNDSVASTGDRILFVKSVSFSGTGVTILNTSSKENVLAASDTYIQNCRRGNATITVLRPNGTPVAAGTQVRVKLRRHKFNFGTAVHGFTSAPWTQSNPPAGTDDYKFQQFLDSHFNMIVPENAGKWAYNEATRDVVTMGTVDAMLTYAETHGLRARMHTCLWDSSPQEPTWVNDLQSQVVGNPTIKQEYREEITERINYYIKDRAHRFEEVDGINEDYHLPLHTTAYGYSGVADIYNEMTAASNGRAKVFVNEYGVINTSGDIYGNWYRQHIQAILDAGGNIDGIGIQGHTSVGDFNPIQVYRTLQQLSVFERPMVITEFSTDETVPEQIPGVLSDMMRLAFGNDQMSGFMMWGFWYPQLWRKGAALVDANWNLTPTGAAYEQLMAQWNTDQTIGADADGIISLTGFYGEYDVIVDGWSYPMVLEKGVADYTIHVGDPGAPYPPTNPGAGSVTASQIRWSWKDNSSNESGFRVYMNAGSGPPTKLDVNRGANYTYWTKTGLQANTRYCMQVASYNGNGESARTNNITKCTLVLPPVYGTSGDCAIACNRGSGNGSVTYLPYTDISFTAANGIGNGPTRASKYGYIWDNSPGSPTNWVGEKYWTGGDLVMNPHADGTYYVHIRAYNGDGVVNSQILNLGPYIIGVKCAELKKMLPGALVAPSNKIVSGVFPDCMYLQEPDRSSGFRVKGSFNAAIGDTVTLSGEVGVDGSEASITNAVITSSMGGGEPFPISMTNRTLGGGEFGLQDAVVDDAGSARLASGLNNIGLLVRTSGRVNYVSPDLTYAYIDDGSRLSDGSGHSGVRLSLENCLVPKVGAWADVTGCCSVIDIGGRTARYLRPRKPDDARFSEVIDTLSNPGFETGVVLPWLVTGQSGVQSGQWHFGILPHSGNRFFGVVGNFAAYSGALSQGLDVVNGNYVGVVWSLVLQGTGDADAAINRVGIDPSGGSDANSPNVQWSAWDTQGSTYYGVWRRLETPVAQVSGGRATLFLQYLQQNPAGWHINCFDDASIVGVD